MRSRCYQYVQGEIVWLEPNKVRFPGYAYSPTIVLVPIVWSAVSLGLDIGLFQGLLTLYLEHYYLYRTICHFPLLESFFLISVLGTGLSPKSIRPLPRPSESARPSV